MSGRLAGKRIGLLTASASRLGGGVLESIINQAAMIRVLGGEPIVFALEDRHSRDDRPRFGETEVRLASVHGPAQIGYAPALGAMLRQAELDCLHLQGIWMYPSAAGAAWARFTGKPYIISPRGMLDPWILARGRWKKALAKMGYERRSWSAASALHALTEREATDIASATGRQDTLTIPNAAPPDVALPASERGQGYIYIGRIHPKKNLTALIVAWTMLDVAARLPATARLTIAGWGEPDHVAQLKAQLATAPASIEFVGPVFGTEKQRILADARFLILPTLSEGLPNAVLEAWAAGTPTLMSKECNLAEGFAARAAIDCGMAVPAIAGAIDLAARLSGEEWLVMARAASHLAAGPFAPSAIAAKWGDAYEALMRAKH
jgi:poly(glycerol-phosphate) alpha-glucosyltransferase